MIQNLSVNNYAIIDNLEINFSDGFNIITGETGAGKSILLGALGLIMGNRADTKVLFDLSEKCIVEAKFDVRGYGLQNLIEENDFDYDDELIIRREILPNSKSRAFVNDSPANLKTLRTISSELLDLHQQFDTLGLNNEEIQLGLLDAYSSNQDLLEVYVAKYEQYLTDIQKLKRLVKQKEQAEKDQELLQYHLKEFEDLSLEPGQLILWEQERDVLENAEHIKNILSKSAFALNEADPSLISNLEDLKFELNEISSFHLEIEKITEQYLHLIEELKDISSSMARQADLTDLDPVRLSEIQEKLELVYKIQAKHKVNDEEEIMKKWEEISNKISSFKQSDKEINELKLDLKNQKEELSKRATQISERRKKAAPKLCQRVVSNLKNLGMDHARFEIAIEELEDFDVNGMDKIKFMFAANIGSRMQEISEVASGGELSRLSLCIKTELAKSVKLPTLIFDEIDSGVSGNISMKMGRMIKELSQNHQIINITHSPQIASKADIHYRIFKENAQDRSYTKMIHLEEDERIIEIAKMLSGDPPSEAAIENAKNLRAQ